MATAPKDDLAKVVDHVTVTDAQREKALALVSNDLTIGDAHALRQAGVAGTTGQLRAYAKTELADAFREARYPIEPAKRALYQVAIDITHQSWQRANKFFLETHGGPEFRPQQRVDVNHSGEVRNPDVAAAIERFTSTIVRLAARGPEELPPGPTGS